MRNARGSGNDAAAASATLQGIVETLKFNHPDIEQLFGASPDF
jgi:hypothetical protein